MADVTISELDPVVPPSGSVLPFSDGITTSKSTIEDLLKNASKVGIGTTSPSSKLTVNGAIAATGQGRFAGWYASGDMTGLAAEIGISGGEGYLYAYNRSNSTYSPINIGTGNSLLQLNTDGNANLTGNLNVSGYIKGVLTRAVAINTNGASSYAFTSIPSWVKRITVMFANISTTTTSNFYIQLGTSAGYATSNYLSMKGGINNTGAGYSRVVDKFELGGQTAGNYSSGTFILTNLTGNQWTGTGTSGDTSTLASFTAGHCFLSSTLDRLQFVSSAGNFDSGTINIMYEG